MLSGVVVDLRRTGCPSGGELDSIPAGMKTLSRRQARWLHLLTELRMKVSQ